MCIYIYIYIYIYIGTLARETKADVPAHTPCKVGVLSIDVDSNGC